MNAITKTLALTLLLLANRLASAQEAKPEEDKRTPEVKKFVEHYFTTWSTPDIDAYADCFITDAVIQFIDPRGQLHSQGKKAFIAEQRAVQSRNPGKEVPESIDIRFEPNLARAVVYWKLTMGKRVDYGYDHFTLARQDGKWKIVNLVFYKADKPE
jgi:pyroglutamyl-peptidase